MPGFYRTGRSLPWLGFGLLLAGLCAGWLPVLALTYAAVLALPVLNTPCRQQDDPTPWRKPVGPCPPFPKPAIIPPRVQRRHTVAPHGVLAGLPRFK